MTEETKNYKYGFEEKTVTAKCERCGEETTHNVIAQNDYDGFNFNLKCAVCEWYFRLKKIY